MGNAIYHCVFMSTGVFLIGTWICQQWQHFKTIGNEHLHLPLALTPTQETKRTHLFLSQ